jgi:hypothetical protein
MGPTIRGVLIRRNHLVSTFTGTVSTGKIRESSLALQIIHAAYVIIEMPNTASIGRASVWKNFVIHASQMPHAVITTSTVRSRNWNRGVLDLASKLLFMAAPSVRGHLPCRAFNDDFTAKNHLIVACSNVST